MTATASRISRTAFGFAFVLVAALTGATAMAQAQETAWARVISATPSAESTGNIGYNVTYEYGGRQYTTRMDSRPGSHVPVQSSAYGVTTQPVQPQSQLAPAPLEQTDEDRHPQYAAPWEHATPEPGVVISGGAPAYRPAYVAPAPVYVQPAYGYAYPPVGISLNLGYSRGWGGGSRWHGGHRGWHGGHRGGHRGWHR